MPTGIDVLSNELHASGHYVLEKAIEDKRSHKPIGNGAFQGLIVRSVIGDLSENGRASLNRYIAETTRKDGKYFDTLLVTLQGMHIFTDDDPRFKEEFRQVYARIYAPHNKKESPDLREHHLGVERAMAFARQQQAKS